MNFRYFFLAFIYTLTIIYFSSLPDQPTGAVTSLSEQIISNFAHIPAYALLTFLWLRSFGKHKDRKRLLTLKPFILMSLIIFAISDEIHQSFVPGRTASFMDIGLDVIGIFLGMSASKTKGIFKVVQGN